MEKVAFKDFAEKLSDMAKDGFNVEIKSLCLNPRFYPEPETIMINIWKNEKIWKDDGINRKYVHKLYNIKDQNFENINILKDLDDAMEEWKERFI